MRLGIDISTYLDELKGNAKYYDKNKEIDPLKLFRENNVDFIRLRVWNDPYSKSHKPYLGGTNSLEEDLKIIQLTKEYGYQYLIDFHYSDFWCDPGKQTLPKAWMNKSFNEVVDEVYKFTKESLLKLKEHNIEVPYIQIGNEITNGMLWPYGKLNDNPGGKRTNYENLITLLRSGIRGAKEVYQDSKIIIHLERSNDYKIYEEFFNELQKANLPYDIIGMSYYPYWHGTMDELFFNIKNCREKFHKDVMIVELGYGFTLEDYLLTDNGRSELKVTKENLEAKLDFDISISGQEQFVEAMISRSQKEKLEGIVYWEPLWIPGDTICWSSEEGQIYIDEAGKPTRNEWSNQCLFDYKGKKLPAFDKFKL